jgi:hypothetical protein
MRFHLEFVDDTTCYVEADDFDDDGKTICFYRYVPEGADPLALTAYSDDSVHPVRRFRTRASEAAQRPTLGALSR